MILPRASTYLNPALVCLSVREHISETTLEIVTNFCAWLGPSRVALWYIMYFLFTDDVMFAHNGRNRRCKKAYTESDSSTGSIGLGAESDIYDCLVLCIALPLFCYRNTKLGRQKWIVRFILRRPVYRSNVILFDSYCANTHALTRQTDCSTWTTKWLVKICVMTDTACAADDSCRKLIALLRDMPIYPTRAACNLAPPPPLRF